jgi:hypothetical protein
MSVDNVADTASDVSGMGTPWSSNAVQYEVVGGINNVTDVVDDALVVYCNLFNTGTRYMCLYFFSNNEKQEHLRCLFTSVSVVKIFLPIDTERIRRSCLLSTSDTVVSPA